MRPDATGARSFLVVAAAAAGTLVAVPSSGVDVPGPSTAAAGAIPHRATGGT